LLAAAAAGVVDRVVVQPHFNLGTQLAQRRDGACLLGHARTHGARRFLSVRRRHLRTQHQEVSGLEWL
jgi:hypothetical protein